MDSTARMNARYAPMDRSHIPGFPKPMPKVDWLDDLPIFKDEKKDNVALHLVRFHMHVRSLKVHFPEDCLMRMFMATLEGKAWSWYKSLENGSIYSLASSPATANRTQAAICDMLIKLPFSALSAI